MADWLYSDIVKDHFVNPRNVLYEDEESFPANARGKTGNVKCGDEMLMLLKIENDIITDTRWKTYGCASAIASTSILSETIKGMNIKDAYALSPEDLVNKLGGLPDYKIHCSVLGDKALRAAIDDYLVQTNRKGIFQEASTEICHCLGITDKDIENAFKQGAKTWEAIQQSTKIGTVCGKCKDKTLELLHNLMHIYS